MKKRIYYTNSDGGVVLGYVLAEVVEVQEGALKLITDLRALLRIYKMHGTSVKFSLDKNTCIGYYDTFGNFNTIQERY